MKRNLLLLIVLFSTMTMMAQNGKISYQAVVRDNENHLVYDTPLQVTVELANSETGAAVYTESHQVTSNSNGLISLLIGDGEVLPGSNWNAVQWNTAWVKATIRKSGESTALAVHHLPLSAVPYALYADEVDTLFLQNYLTTHDYGNDDYVTHEQLNDTLNSYYTKGNVDSKLNDYEKKADLCNDVKGCIKDTLEHYTTSDQIDTLLGAYYDTTHMKTVLHDTADAVRGALADTADAIRGSIGNGTLTIKNNGSPIGSFKANQKTDTEVDITTPTNVAIINADNHFTGTNTVPSGYTLTGTNATNASNCGNVVVNACDLLTVFDSLSRRMDSLSRALAETQRELDDLKNAVPPVFNSLVLSDITANSITATANFSNTGAAISSYQFCIKRSDLSGATPTCFTSPTNQVTFTGLKPFTSYEVTVSATNVAGTTSSTPQNATTLAANPTGDLSAESLNPNSIKVTVNHLDFGGAPSGTVNIYYKQKGTSTTCSDNVSDYDNPITIDVTLTSPDDSTVVKVLEDLDASVLYCMLVKLANANSTSVLGPQEVMSGGDVALAINCLNANEATLDVCENSSVTARYEAVPNQDTPESYTYQWSVDGSSVTENTGHENYVEFAHTVGNHTILCVATHPTLGVVTNTYTLTVTNTGKVPQFSVCSDSLRVNLGDLTFTDTVNWGDSDNDEIVTSNPPTHLYQTSKTYTITGKNSSGCVASKEISVGLSTMHACNVSNKFDNEGGSGNKIDSLQDVDGNWYTVVQIGNQCWMKSNLRTTHYSDGTPIANGTGSGANNTMSESTAYYYRPTTSSIHDDSYDLAKYNVNTYGLYYNWKAVMNGAPSSIDAPSGVQGVCPNGWHVPSLREWDTLFAYVQTLPDVTYYDLHQIGYLHAMASSCEWEPCNNGCPGHYQNPARNSSEFSAVPTGEAAGIFRYNHAEGVSPQATYFWTATGSTPFAGSPQSYACEMYGGSTRIRKDDSYTIFGYSVRCLRDYEGDAPTVTPTVTTTNYSNLGLHTATLNGAITDNGVTISAKGFKWKKASESDYHTEYLTTTENTLTFTLNSLEAGTDYTYFAFAIFEGGTAFGQEVPFKTLTPPSVTTGNASSVGVNTATLNGVIVPGDLPVIEKGFEWKLATEDNYQQLEVKRTITDNNYDTNLTILAANNSYTFRAYVTYEGGTAYGVEVTFLTKTPPTVTTHDTVHVGTTTATLRGEITSPGNVTITGRGIEYKRSTDAEYTQVGATEENPFTVSISNLDVTKLYNYRAYATYEGGTVYGNPMSFTTKTPPTVSTGTATSIETNTATLNGSIGNAGNVNIKKVGFKLKADGESTYDTIPGDTANNNITANLTGLQSNTKYYFIAFIDYEDGTINGDEGNFTTEMEPPTVTTLHAENVGSKSAELKGTVQANNNVIDAKGFKWRLATETAYHDTAPVTVTSNEFTYNLTNLTPSTEYIYQAYATTANGTYYGDTVHFTTTAQPALSVASNASSNPTVCEGGSTAVTYTATVQYGETDVTDDYTYGWEVPTGLEYTVDGATCTVTYTTTGAYTVTCTATSTAEGTLPSANSEITVESASGTVPTFTLCVDDNTKSVTIKSQSDNDLAFNWGGAGSPSGNGYAYTTDGVYTIMATNGSCSSTKRVSVGVATLRPCTVNTPHTNDEVYTSTTGGLETLNDEGKVVTVQDQDGHNYAVTEIGGQCWMRTNLRTSKFNDGSTIPGGPGTTVYSKTTPYYYKNNSYIDYIFGYFYNWPAAASNLCPKGWHVPTQTDWLTMISNAGASTQGSDGTGAVYLAGSCGWNNPSLSSSGMTPGSYNNPERDKWGFTAIPAGRYGANSFLGAGEDVYFWSSIEVDDEHAMDWYMGNYPGLINAALDKDEGRLVRCMRDLESGSSISSPSVTTENASALGTTFATLNATINDPDNQGGVTARGFMVKIKGGTEKQIVVSGTGNTFSADTTELIVDTVYIYKAFIVVGGETKEGEEVTFRTLVPPTVTTQDPSRRLNAATLNATITNPKNVSITAKGFEMWTTPDGLHKQIVGVGTGNTFSADTAGLTANTSYTCKAYITYENQTVYDEGEVSFTLPVVFTAAATSIGTYSATLNAIISDPDQVIDTKGFKWKPFGDETYTLSTTEVTETTDGFTATISGLDPNAQYKFKAFITFNENTEEGEELNFTTLPLAPSLSIVSNAPAESLSVCNNGSIAITYRAVVEEGTTDVTNNYTYSWTVPTGVQHSRSGNTCTVIYTTASDNPYTVSCTATPKSSGDALTDAKSITIGESSETAPIFTTCEDGLTLHLIEVTSSTSIIHWGDGDTNQNPRANNVEQHTYATAGIYTIVAESTPGCSIAKTVTIGNTHSCTVNSVLANEVGSGTTLNAVKDIENHEYPVVQIGSQCWMAQNLRTKGSIPEFQAGVTPLGAPFYYEASTAVFNKYTEKYGLYYNRWAALNGYDGSQLESEDPVENVQGICPDGWHIPSKVEWFALINELKEEGNIGAGKIAGGCDWEYHWSQDIEDAYPCNYLYPLRNISGFNALPAGQFEYDWGFDYSTQLYYQANFWSSSFRLDPNPAVISSYYFRISCVNSQLTTDLTTNGYKNFETNRHDAFSVRCVRDAN